MGDGRIRAGGEAGVKLGEPPARGDAAVEAGRGSTPPSQGGRPADAAGRGAGQSGGRAKDARQQEVAQSGKLKGHEISVRFRESAGPKQGVKPKDDGPNSTGRGHDPKGAKAEAESESRAERAESRSERRTERAEDKSERAESKSERRSERAEARSESRAESKSEDKSERRADSESASRSERRAEKAESKSESRSERAESGDGDGRTDRSERREARAEGRDEGRADRGADRDTTRDSKSSGRGVDRGEKPEADFDGRTESRGDESRAKSERSADDDRPRETRSESRSESRDEKREAKSESRAETSGARRDAGDDRREAKSEGRSEARDDRREARSESRAERHESRAEKFESRDDRRDARAEGRTHDGTERGGDDDRDRGPKLDKNEPKFDSKSGPKFETVDGRRADANGWGRPPRTAPDPPGHAHGHERRGDAEAPRADNHSRAHDNGRGRHAPDLPDVGHDARSITSSVRDYLRGASKGADLPPGVRRALDAASNLLAEDFRQSLNFGRGHGDDKVLKIIDRALADVARTLEKSFGSGGRFAHAPEQAARDAVDELLQAALLNRHFKQMEKTGGRPVQQAEELVARLLYGTPRGGADGEATHGPRLSPAELLRDLRSGAFFPAQEARSPFPLTGRARVVTEMMELMRTLDAWERLMQRAEALRVGARAAAGSEAAAAPKSPEAALAAFLKSYFGGGAGPEALDEFLAALFPTLPGRAGRVEVVRLVAALEGALADAQGKVLVARDGTPLKLDQLLWLGTAGGLLGSGFEGEAAPTRLSPLLIYGFDAVYSVIGFDGRTLAPPHFAAVQAQVNGSEPEWVFGQPPLTEGWMHALIERLKDAALADHNLLGEMLEEALADGRFHTVLVSGAVEEGAPVPDSFAVEKLLPGWSVGAAFA